MDLILWRHADAEDERAADEDLLRALTPKGEKQAQRMATWLDRQLPEGMRVLCSPARRAEQTARALGRKYKLRDELSPAGTADDLLALAQWPKPRGLVLVVGHQPQLGAVAARLLQLADPICHIRKGAVWWLRSREREGRLTTSVVAVHGPDLV